MQKIGLFYASSTGNTERIAKMIRNELSDLDVTLYNLDSCPVDAMSHHSHLILGVSTWGEGDLQDDWESFLPHFEALDMSSRRVAFFGLGDQESYSDNYLDAMGILYDVALRNGAEVIGSWPIEGYEFDDSAAVRNDEFVGLALDEDNQDDRSAERVKSWCTMIRPYFAA